MLRRLALILGTLFAIAAIFLIKFYLDQQRQIIHEVTKEEFVKQQEREASVVIAKKDIARGAAIEADMLEEKSIPRDYLQPQVVGSPERIIGMVALAPISQGEQITLTKLTQLQQAKAASLAMTTPVGKRAVTISVDNIASLAGMIKPGDYVDVVTLIPVPLQTADGKEVTQVAVTSLFQNVLILAVGRDIGRESAPASGGRYQKESGLGEQQELSFITLALTPQEANLIAFVQEQGKIKLVLRSPADSKLTPMQPTSWDTLFQHLMPESYPRQERSPAVKEAAPASPGKQIEIYRGLKKETVTLSTK